ncbi:uncharacterized protein LOC135483113 isoform X2 [Lineus longissimus]|uniref:uncharacterized protein LOC135483113 isoform X2 n=1 Tax=Lineus longissimus TaxID=88925 RepID=UPI00315D38DC
MTVKRKDFQKTAAYLQEFLLKLNEDAECAELRDALNLALLHMQKYYRALQNRLQDNLSKNGNNTLRSSVRGLSPMTPFRDAPDKFQWKWIDLENPRVSMSMTFDASSSLGNLPMIFHAAKSGDNELIQDLAVKNINVINDVDAIGRTPLMYAVHFEQYESVKCLINLGADVNACAHDGSTSIHRACHDGLSKAADLLIEANCDVQIQDQLGRAPIHWAVVSPAPDCLMLLIQNYANVNIRDMDGASPCMWACRMDHIKHFEYLSRVENQVIDEADGIERDNSGRTWMHWAVRRVEPLECLKTLLTEQTAPIKDDDGKTVMLLAAELGSLAACKLILEIAGKECINDRDDQDRSPLHLCVIGGHGEVANYLLDKGADLDTKDKFNASPLDYARGRQLHYCLLILASHMRQRAREGPGRTPDSERGSFMNGILTRRLRRVHSAPKIYKRPKRQICWESAKQTIPLPPIGPSDSLPLHNNFTNEPDIQQCYIDGQEHEVIQENIHQNDSSDTNFSPNENNDEIICDEVFDDVHVSTVQNSSESEGDLVEVEVNDDPTMMSDGSYKPITPPHPPKAPPPTTPRNFKRPLVRSSSLSKSDTFERSDLRQGLVDRRAKSLDVRDYEELKAARGYLGTDYEEPKTARDAEMESEEDRQEPDYESLDTARWAKEDRLPNGDIQMEDEQDDHTLVEDKPAGNHLNGQNGDVDEGVSIGEMDVSDLEGEDSDQATVIHRPHARPKPGPPTTMKFQPHPPPQSPNAPHQAPPTFAKPQEPPTPRAHPPPKYVERPEEEYQNVSPPPKKTPQPVPAPRGMPLQGRIPPPRHTSSLANQAQNQMRPVPKQDIRQKSPPSNKLRGPVPNQRSHGMMDRRSPHGSHELSQRSSSQASSLDVNSHELHDEVTDLLKHPAQAPLTPPEVKRKPPLPPQLMPLSQPRMPGSHIQLPPANKSNKRKKKKKKERQSDASNDLPPATKGYTAPLQPPPYGNLQPQVRSASLHRRSQDQLGRYSQEEQLQYDDHYTNANRPAGPLPPYSRQGDPMKQPRNLGRSGLFPMESEESLDTIGTDSNTQDNQFNTPGMPGFRGGMNSSRYAGADPMGPKERGSGFLSPDRSRGQRAKTAKYELEEEPSNVQVEGHKMNYTRHQNMPPAHLSHISPPHLAPPPHQSPGRRSGGY